VLHENRSLEEPGRALDGEPPNAVGRQGHPGGQQERCLDVCVTRHRSTFSPPLWFSCPSA
jgi:hypothetical protein